jgi:hypothetical protein
LHLFPDSIDAWWLRLSPVPLDALVKAGVANPSADSSYFDTQINLPLILVSFALTAGAFRRWSDRRRLWLLLPLLLGALFLTMSLTTVVYRILPFSFTMGQYPYRLVTYVNLAALAGVLIAVRVAQGQLLCAKRGTAFLLLTLAFSAGTLGFKLRQSYYSGPDTPIAIDHLPNTFYGFDDYTTPLAFRPLLLAPQHEQEMLMRVRMTVSPTGAKAYQPLHVHTEGVTFVITQVQSFPWNTMELNGHRIPDEQVWMWYPLDDRPKGEWNLRPYLVVAIPPGDSTLIHRYQPPKTWKRLVALSFTTFAIWIGSLLGLWTSGRTPQFPTLRSGWVGALLARAKRRSITRTAGE